MNRGLVAGIAALALLGSMVTAGAASVGSISGGLFGAAGALTAPTATRAVTDVALTTAGGPPTVSALTATVTGSGLATLNGEAVTVALLNSAGAQVQAVSATLVTGTNLSVATTATITLPVPGSPLASSFASWTVYIAGATSLGGGADATARAITLGSGALAAVTWTSPVIPPSGAAPGTTIVTVTPSNINVYSTCLTVAITGTSSTPVAWGFTIDYSKPPYYGYRPTLDAHAIVASDAGSVLTLKGTSNGNTAWEEWGNNALISNAQTLNILVCTYSYPGALPDEPQAYSVSAPVHGSTWTNTRACIDRTVTGNGIYPFYFGWSTSFDMTAAIALLKTNDAGSPRAFVYQPNPTTPSTYTAGTTTYTMTENTSQEISGTQSVVAELCVSQY
ncbi:MAG: hypothetical protein V4479_07280 [Actinomycetota bacterium]